MLGAALGDSARVLLSICEHSIGRGWRRALLPRPTHQDAHPPTEGTLPQRCCCVGAVPPKETERDVRGINTRVAAGRSASAARAYPTKSPGARRSHGALTACSTQAECLILRAACCCDGQRALGRAGHRQQARWRLPWHGRMPRAAGRCLHRGPWAQLRAAVRCLEATIEALRAISMAAAARQQHQEAQPSPAAQQISSERMPWLAALARPARLRGCELTSARSRR